MIAPPSALGSTPSPVDQGSADPKGNLFKPSGLAHEDLLPYISPTVTAVLVDAAFYLKRIRRICGEMQPEGAAEYLCQMAKQRITDEKGRCVARLYRIFVYDAPPADWRANKPISGKTIDFERTPISQWRRSFHNTLRVKQKVALRLGVLAGEQHHWQIKPGVLKLLINGKKQWSELVDDDFCPAIRQKGVDMKIGLDIASMAYKRQVNRLVLVSGDADFVPAAKLARREGIEFVLDPMGANIRSELLEHIDDLRSTIVH